MEGRPSDQGRGRLRIDSGDGVGTSCMNKVLLNKGSPEKHRELIGADEGGHASERVSAIINVSGEA